jgi:predicted TIM-barrel fold metal-dependent hydrolase
MDLRKRFGVSASAAAMVAALALLAGCGSSSSGSGSASSSSGTDSSASSAPVKIGVDLTYNNTAFWSAYINYQSQYAKQLHIKLLGPLLSAASASLQNQQVEELVNEGAKAVIVNPENPDASHLIDSFGPHRLMVGSDWPVCTLAATYEEVLDLAVSLLSPRLGAADVAAVLAGNARAIYRLEVP